MSRRFITVCAVAVGIVVLAAPASAQGPSLGTFRWNLLPYCDAIVMEVRQIGGGAFQLTGAHDRCGQPGFLAIQGAAGRQLSPRTGACVQPGVE